MGLPRAVLLRRIRNDLDALRTVRCIPVPEFPDDVGFPLTIDITLNGVRGYSAPGQEVCDHRLSVYLSEDYPYERPRLRWRSPIFHPNIMSPEEGGLVCVMAMDRWGFDSDLVSFVDALTDLIKNPNPHDPLASDSCRAAAEWFAGRI